MSQVTGSLTPVWETWIGFQAPGFNLFQPKPLGRKQKMEAQSLLQPLPLKKIKQIEKKLTFDETSYLTYCTKRFKVTSVGQAFS